MNMKSLNIVSLSRKKIVYKYPKKEDRRGWVVTLASFMLIVLSALIIRLSATATTRQMFEVVGKVYNPATPLYKEMTDIVFTDSGEIVADIPYITVNGGVVSWDL